MKLYREFYGREPRVSLFIQTFPVFNPDNWSRPRNLPGQEKLGKIKNLGDYKETALNKNSVAELGKISIMVISPFH